MALINECPTGRNRSSWHRDAPQYGIVAGIYVALVLSDEVPSLRAATQKRAAPEAGRRSATHQMTLERRSAYLVTGDSRNAYEHHIPAVPNLRYSITFRTLRS